MKINKFYVALIFSFILSFFLYLRIQSGDYKLKNLPILTKGSRKTNTTKYLATTTSSQSTTTKETGTEALRKVLQFYESIRKKEFKVFSQNKEDGVIDFLIDCLNLGQNYSGFFVEFGTEDGNQINTRYLKQKRNWTGLLMDGSNENLAINLHKEIILHSNIVQLFQKYNVPTEFDLFSEDTDYGDYWIVEQVMLKYTPKIVVHEVNQQEPELCVTVPKPVKLTYWDLSNYHGASVCAFRCMAARFGYTMVYCESAGVNCFWMRNDVFEKFLNVDSKLAQQVLTPALLYKKPGFTYGSTGKPWLRVNCTI
jgi:hypothetical protein